MKKTLFILAAALLSVGAGCEKAPSLDLGEDLKVQVDQPGIEVTTGDATQDATASSDDRKGEREDGEDGQEREDDENEGGGRAVTQPAPAPVPAPTPTAGKSYTMAQVSAHASAASCWSAIGGSIYDLTSWIDQHPGGAAAIKSLCGIDGTAAFNAQHGGQGNPAQELASLKIGALVK